MVNVTPWFPKCLAAGDSVAWRMDRTKVLGGLAMRVLFLLLALLSGVAAEALGVAIDPEQLAKDCRPTVLLIQCEDANQQVRSVGSGFLVTSDGTVVTNYHVIDGASRIVAKSYIGRRFAVKSIVATDPAHDLAILKLDVANTPWLPLADERLVNPGSPLVVIGNPTGLEGSITQGIVSAIRNVKSYGPVFQISAAISPGSSGSPVLTPDGKVLGVVTFMKLDGQALNFAVSVQSLKALLGWNGESSPALAGLPSVQNADAERYRPNPAGLGSPEEDQQVSKDPAFAKLRTLEQSKKTFLMLDLAKELAAKFPKSSLAQRRLADAYFYAEFNEECLKACKKAVDMDPKSGRAWNNLAIAYKAVGNERASLSAYREGIKAAPADAKLWTDYAYVLKEKDPRAAAEAARTAVTFLNEGRGTDEESIAYPLKTDAARLLLGLRKDQEAYDAALVGVRLNAEEADAWLTLAECATVLKKYTHVKPYLDRAKSLGAPEDTLYLMLADAEEDQEHWDLAADCLTYAYRANDRDKELLYRLIFASLNRATLAGERITEISGYVESLAKMDGRMGQEAASLVRDEIRRRRGN